jgi:hypothetical protein
LTVNMFFNSSWALFPPAVYSDESKKGKKLSKLDEINPIAFSGKALHTAFKEVKLISTLRAWSSKIFTNNKVLSSSFINELREVGSKGAEKPDGKYYDFDL